MMAAARCRSCICWQPVIICCGYSVDEVSEYIYNDRYAGFMHKPYRPAELKENVMEVLATGGN